MIDALASCVAMANIESESSDYTEKEMRDRMDIDIFGDDDPNEEDEQLLDTAY